MGSRITYTNLRKGAKLGEKNCKDSFELKNRENYHFGCENASPSPQHMCQR